MIIKSLQIWDGDRFVADSIQVEDGKIVARLGYTVTADIDYGDRMVLPGFIDIHTHGGFGCDIMDTDEAGIAAWAGGLPRFGTTAFVATTFTDSQHATLRAIANVVGLLRKGTAGAEILGINLEGPFIGDTYVGGMEACWIQPHSIAEFDLYRNVAKGLVKICTIAPECDNAFVLLDHIVSCGVIASAGHTAADYETINRAARHGLRNMTHTYNCMSPLHHREPGCVGAAMLNDALYCECICDNAMVSAPAAAILSKMKGRQKLIFVTDALELQGMSPGIFYASGHNTEVRADGSCVEVGTGMYMGSSLGMNSILKTAVEVAGIDLAWAVDAMAFNAATLLGIADKKGQLLPDFDADIAVLDKDYSVVQTYCKGVAQL